MNYLHKKPGAAICLSSLGINNLGWIYEDALLLLENLISVKCIILGGDVYTYSNGVVKSTGDSWFYSGRMPQESVDVAKEYLNRFYLRNGSNYCYSFSVLYANEASKYEMWLGNT